MVNFIFEEQAVLNQIITKDKSYEEVLNDLENMEYENDLIKDILRDIAEKFKKLTKEEFEYIKNHPFEIPFEIKQEDENTAE